MVIAPSALRAIGTYNFDFRLAPAARGVLITKVSTAKGAGAATLALTLRYYDEASGTFVDLQDYTATTPVTPGIAATADGGNSTWSFTVYPTGATPALHATLRKYTAPVPSSLRLVAVVAVDTITFSVGGKSLY